MLKENWKMLNNCLENKVQLMPHCIRAKGTMFWFRLALLIIRSHHVGWWMRMSDGRRSHVCCCSCMRCHCVVILAIVRIDRIAFWQWRISSANQDDMLFICTSEYSPLYATILSVPITILSHHKTRTHASIWMNKFNESDAMRAKISKKNNH